MLVGIALLSAAARAQRVGDSLLQDALELGRRGEPIPYTLHMNSAGSGDAGKVYTPLAARPGPLEMIQSEINLKSEI
jgi:hypothetical protein